MVDETFCGAVTGLHDMDEFVQSQLILAVSISVEHLFQIIQIVYFWNSNAGTIVHGINFHICG